MLSIVLVAYACALLLMAWKHRDQQPGHFLLAGRALSLPALIATMVTTWYGGILGVGEYAWRYGLSTWAVFGLPYYLAAVVFGLWLAPRLRRNAAVSIPDMLESAYGRPAALTGALGIWAGTIPVAYLLMLAVLIQQVTGWSMWSATLAGAAFSAFYVGLAGFRSVVRTDALQMVLMFTGFGMLFAAAMGRVGGLSGLWSSLPESHRAWDGGLGWQAIVVWYFIAFQTVVEPAFYQRVFAARSPAVARAGLLLSVGAWAIFDFLSISTGLAARVLVPGLEDPLAAYPLLAAEVLGPAGQAIFTVALFAIVMSTLDSYLFLAASTFGHDLMSQPGGTGERRRIRIGLAVSAALAVAGALVFDSAIEVWHHVGTVLASALLWPVLAVHLPARWRPSAAGAQTAMISAAVTALAWLSGQGPEGYPLGLEPLFPAIGLSGAVLAVDRLTRRVWPAR